MYIKTVRRMINNKFLHYKTLEAFRRDLNAGNIPETSIVFIKDRRLIWTHGTIFDGEEYILPVDKRLDPNSENPVANRILCKAFEDVYTKREINDRLAIIPIMKTKVVDSLPQEDIDDRYIYIIKSDEDGKLFSEYIYVDKEWVLLGTQTRDLNLDDYVKREELSELLQISDSIDSLRSKLENEITRASNFEDSANRRITALENQSGQSGGTTIINNGDGIKHVILTQSEYDTLSQYENNAIYFIVESKSNTWTFGDTFPITFNDTWTFGGAFPVKLT